MGEERQGETLRYRRVLLKLSGEALLGKQSYGIDEDVLAAYATEVRNAVEHGLEVAIVIGGGNIFRGVNNATKGMTRAHADYMGMLATMINAMALQDALEQAGLQTRLQSSIKMEEIAEPFIRRRAIRHLEKNRVVIFGAGTGNPYFTTDTAAALRALELDADALLMAKNRVDGVYSSDPRTDGNARRYNHITHQEALEKNLKVMDASALALCRDNNLPIIVFDMSLPGTIRRVVNGESVGTLVSSTENDTHR